MRHSTLLFMKHIGRSRFTAGPRCRIPAACPATRAPVSRIGRNNSMGCYSVGAAFSDSCTLILTLDGIGTTGVSPADFSTVTPAWMSSKSSGHDRCRIRQGPYRIVYAIEDDRLLVFVFRVRHRRDAGSAPALLAPRSSQGTVADQTLVSPLSKPSEKLDPEYTKVPSLS
ncbi:MAG: type II toxin-antitoxin system RelE/ParE family toxin [Thermoanaerobaculia bacterium]